jgi:hypothetical protein
MLYFVFKLVFSNEQFLLIKEKIKVSSFFKNSKNTLTPKLKVDF